MNHSQEYSSFESTCLHTGARTKVLINSKASTQEPRLIRDFPRHFFKPGDTRSFLIKFVLQIKHRGLRRSFSKMGGVWSFLSLCVLVCEGFLFFSSEGAVSPGGWSNEDPIASYGSEGVVVLK